jgi:hypothetical protein
LTIHRPLPGSPLPAHAPGDTIELVGGASYPFMRGVQSGTPAAPTVITYSGTARPIVAGIELGAKSHVVLRGLHVRGTGSGDGLSMIGPGENVWADECLFTDWTNGANVNGHDGDRIGGGFRRCIFDRIAVDGIYLGKRYKQMLLEQDWFRGCGDKWVYSGQDTDSSNTYRGNVGIGQPGMTGGFVFRAGGLIEDNWAHGTDLGFAVGVHTSPLRPTATLRRNTVTGGIGRCIAFSLCATENARLEDNVVAHAAGGGMRPRILSQEHNDFGQGCTGTVETGTRIASWDDGVDNTTDPKQALYVTGRYSQPPSLSGVQAHQPRGRGFAWFQEGA